MNAPAKVDVLAVLEAVEAYVDDAAQFPEQFKPGVVKRHQAQFREARAAVAELIEDATLALELLESENLGDSYAAGILRKSLARVGGDK